MKRPQRTIAQAVEYDGVGVNSGTVTHLRLLPAETNTGVVFVRADLSDRPEVPALVDYVSSSARRTILRSGAAEVQMIEHILSALVGLHIDNVIVEVDKVELPCGDGSAAHFTRLIQSAGIAEQEQEKEPFVVTEPVSVAEGGSTIVALPADEGLAISYTLDYRSPDLGTQYYDTVISEETFLAELASARTFCLASEIAELKLMGLGKGASYDNILVVDKGTVRENRLRFPDEFARHKVLDLLGDLSLLGTDLSARIIAVRSGHSLNIRLTDKLKRAMQQKRGFRKPRVFDVAQIRDILPHRYPFLLVDRVLELDGSRRAVGIKNITINEEFFQGHWPDRPVMPGVLQIEAMAQLAGFLLLRRYEDTSRHAFLSGLDKVRLRKPVVPGDQLLLEAEAIKFRNRVARLKTRATVDGELVAEAEMLFVLAEPE